MKWAMTSEVWGSLATIEKSSSTGQYILDVGTQTMASYPYVITNGLSNNTLVLGSWDQVVLAMWGSVDLTVDPFSGSTAGTLRVVALQDVDVLVRNPQSFSFNNAVTA